MAMPLSPLRILQVNTHDARGGAARVAQDLRRAYGRMGLVSWLAVGRKQTDDPGVLPFSEGENDCSYASFMRKTGERVRRYSGRVRGAWRLSEYFRIAADPKRWWEVSSGREDFSFPATWRLLDLPPEPPDIVHCHNLHGNYFDLRALPTISRQKPLLITLHDSWLLGGHCAHPISCDLWLTGCGDCPDLTLYPPIRKDATEHNWRQKRDIYRDSRFHIATPSRWLMDKVHRSILEPAILGSRVIPNGVDLSLFHPGDGRETRSALGLPADARILFFAADWLERNVFKDFKVIREAVTRISGRSRVAPVLLLAMGSRKDVIETGSMEIRFLPYQSDPEKISMYYRCADLYLHAAKAETFGLTIAEAMACGIPVVATGVGGIPEVVRSLTSWGETEGASSGEPTGILVPPGSGEAMAEGIERLLGDEELRKKLGENAARDARTRFDLARQAQAYLEWYETILGRDRRSPVCAPPA